MLTFIVHDHQGESESLDAGYCNEAEGMAWFFTETGRLLRIIPTSEIRRIDVVWPADEAAEFDERVTRERREQAAIAAAVKLAEQQR